MPIYPAAMSTVAQPLMPPGRWHPARVTAAVLCFVALVLMISSSFLPLFSGELDAGFDSIEVTVTPWSMEVGEALSGPGVNNVPRVGYPMVFSAVVLACAAAACWYAATPGARPVAGRTAGIVTSVSAAFLIGTAWTTALLVSNGVDGVLLLGGFGGVDADASYLTGYWFLLTSCLLAVAAAVLSLLPTRQPVWHQPTMPPPVNPFVATPPFGIALPVEPAPPHHALRIDPLTGQPLGHGIPGPFGGPPAMQPFQQPLAGPLTARPPSREAASPPAGLPAVQPFQAPAPVDPSTGQSFAPHTTVDPLTGQPLPAGSAVPMSPPTGIPAPAEPTPFTTEPVGPVSAGSAVNGMPTTPVAEPAPIVLPDAPPLPETPPGPAVPATEDPLADPPRS
jgi:hypothetical protein